MIARIVPIGNSRGIRIPKAVLEQCEMADAVELDRATAALFDTPRFARNLEALYARMWERHVAGEKPAMIALR